jgi:hypothetical protein
MVVFPVSVVVLEITRFVFVDPIAVNAVARLVYRSKYAVEYPPS